MNDTTIELLQSTFRDVFAVKDDAAALFYERLFALDPSLRILFADADMKNQGTKLMMTLGVVINNLRDFDKMVPQIAELAVRHQGYGVKESHYETVGNALIQTLALFFGPRFTPEARAAWEGAYGAVASTMINATRQQAAVA